jgi:acetolactate synthase-1/2/3 large subunit
MSGRPGPVLVDIPGRAANGTYMETAALRSHYQPQVRRHWRHHRSGCRGEKAKSRCFILAGVINSGPAASQLLRELVGATNFDHLDLMGLGVIRHRATIGSECWACTGCMEANMAMHDAIDDQYRRAL